MRLKEFEITAIKSAINAVDPAASIFLFGSRADDAKKGGDIDLLVMSSKMTSHDKRAVKMKLYESIGEQKIDIIVAVDDSDPFVKIALATGVKL